MTGDNGDAIWLASGTNDDNDDDNDNDDGLFNDQTNKR